MSAKADDTECAAAIIAALEMGGALRDPRPPSDDPRADGAGLPLVDYAARDVRRSLDRLRMLPAWLHAFAPDVEIPTAAYCHTVAKDLRKVAFTDEARETVRQLEAVWQTPPARADALKYRCADEAFELMRRFTGTAAGRPFRTFAALLYGAVTGVGADEPGASMKRACDLVLRDRKRGDMKPEEYARKVARRKRSRVRRRPPTLRLVRRGRRPGSRSKK